MDGKIFAYCERGQDPSFWAEPINALTNAAFIIAATIGLVLWSQRPVGERGIIEIVLVGIVFAIGTGSFLFHTFAEPWAAAADTIPIGIFMVSYLAYALARYLRWHPIAVVVALVVFFIALWQSSVFRCNGGPCFNGSLAYAPAFLALVLIGGWLVLRKQAEGSYVLGAGLVFVVSLTFRTLDQDICSQTQIAGFGPIGLHFLWHILNAIVLGLLLVAAMRFGMVRRPTT
ncbi:MAG: ceramidase domain-containing protein [Pseudomonadota bacterium]